MDTIYSSHSSTKLINENHVNRRRMLGRVPAMITANNEVRQRVASAKILRMKQLQNQLTDARKKIAELTAENRLLQSIHKRQDSALAKYENSSAELPQLLSSHAEELRVWQARVKSLKQQNKDLQDKIKQKDTLIISLSDENKHLTQLNKDRNLKEREKLAEQLKYLEERLLDKDNDLKLLNRRLQLEVKSFKVQIQHENQKFKDCHGKLERALGEINRLNILLESNNLKGSPAMYRAKTSRRHRNRSADDVNRAFVSGADSLTKITPKVSPHKCDLLAPKHLSPLNKQVPGMTKQALLKRGEQQKPETPGGWLSEEGDFDDENLIAPQELSPLSDSLPDNSKRKNSLMKHKKHIEEIEAKLQGNHQSTTTTTIETIRIQSTESVDFEQLLKQEELEIENLKHQLKDNLIRKEDYLDEICDEVTKASPVKKDNGGKTLKKKNDIDPQKKTKLLAALKAIDGKDSYEEN